MTLRPLWHHSCRYHRCPPGSREENLDQMGNESTKKICHRIALNIVLLCASTGVTQTRPVETMRPLEEIRSDLAYVRGLQVTIREMFTNPSSIIQSGMIDDFG